MMPRNIHERGQHWVWVTTPEYYAEPDGSDRKDLEPGQEGGWWTCHRDTRQGDLVLLYRTAPRMDFGYLFRAESNAYSITDDPSARQRGWDYGCDYSVLYKFENPLTLDDLRRDQSMNAWGAFRANFRRRVYAIPEPVWQRLISQISKGESGFVEFLDRNKLLRAKHVPPRKATSSAPRGYLTSV
jgi:hypothetical protein